MAAPQAQFYNEGLVIPHTPSGALTGGEPTQVSDGLVGIPSSDIAAAATDSVQITGIIKIVGTSAVGNLGDNVWWDNDGDPVGGTAGTGAATTIASAGDFWIGTLTLAKTAAATHALVNLNKENPALPAWQNKTHVTITSATLDIQDNGKVIHATADNSSFTLPATIAGWEYILVNDAADAGALVGFDPNAADLVAGPDIAGTDNKDHLNTKTTAIRGDWCQIVGDGLIAGGWVIRNQRGIWATEG